MKKFIFYFLIFLSTFTFAQRPDNALQGYYGIKGSGSLYGSFNFDGNGKLLIGEMAHGDYFTRNDSLIIYPDKDIFIFKIKGKELHGISTWVENEVWKFNKDSISVNNRQNPELSQKKAELLAQYYDKRKIRVTLLPYSTRISSASIRNYVTKDLQNPVLIYSEQKCWKLLLAYSRKRSLQTKYSATS